MENDGIFFGLAAGKTRRVRARDESDEQENEPCQAVPPLNRAEAVRYNQELGRYGPATPGQYERPSVLCNHCCPRQYNVRQATQWVKRTGTESVCGGVPKVGGRRNPRDVIQIAPPSRCDGFAVSPPLSPNRKWICARGRF